MELAKKWIMKLIQKMAFSGVDDQHIKLLHAFVDNEGLFQIHTKITLREDSEDFRSPMVLPANHSVVLAMIHEIHLRSCHAGVLVIASTLCEKY